MPGANVDANYLDETNRLVGASSAAEENTGVENLNLESEQGTKGDIDDDAVVNASSSETDDKGQDKGKEGDDGGKDAAKKAIEDDRLDKHPRFQEVIKQKNDALETTKKLEAQIELLTKMYGKPAEGGKDEAKPQDVEKPSFRDITAMEEDELSEWVNDRPKEFFANLYAQVRHELIEEFRAKGQEIQAKNDVQSELGEFAKAHPDFNELFGKDGGEILKYMKENPGRDAQYAYYAITESKQNERIEAAKEAGRKEAEANYKAKRNASNVLGSGSPVTGTGTGDALQDTSKHGGPIAALTKNLLARRRAAT